MLAVADIAAEGTGPIPPAHPVAGPPRRGYPVGDRCGAQGIALARLARFARG